MQRTLRAIQSRNKYFLADLRLFSSIFYVLSNGFCIFVLSWRTSIICLIDANTFAFALSFKSLEFSSNFAQIGSKTLDSISQSFRRNIFSTDLKLDSGKNISATEPKNDWREANIFRRPFSESSSESSRLIFVTAWLLKIVDFNITSAVVNFQTF